MLLPGSDTIIACPHGCGAVARYDNYISGNSFDAVTWTDGRMYGDMLPTQAEFTRCPHCNHFYWISGAEEVGEYDWRNGQVTWFDDTSAPPEGQEVPQVRTVSSAELAEALDLGLGTSRDREKFLRIQLWWALNDCVRQGEAHLFEQQEDLFRKNLQILDELLRDGDEAGQLMRAEIARELGEFETCQVRLSCIPQEYASICKQIGQLAREHNRMVAQLA